MTQGQVLDAAALAALVVGLISLLKPWLETFGPFRKDAASHDAAFQTLNLVLQFVFLCALAASTDSLDLQHNWLVYLAQAFAQATGAHVFYRTTRSTPAAARALSATAKSKLPTLYNRAEAGTAPAPASVTVTATTANVLPATVAE